MSLRRLGKGMANTPDEVRDYLRDALAIVDELDPPEDLRGLAFNHAVSLLSAGQTLFEQVQAGPLGVPVLG